MRGLGAALRKEVRVEIRGHRAPSQDYRHLPRTDRRRRKELPLGLAVLPRDQRVVDCLVAARNQLNRVDAGLQLYIRLAGRIGLCGRDDGARAVIDAFAQIDCRGDDGLHAAPALVVVERITEFQAIVDGRAAALKEVCRRLVGNQLVALDADAVNFAGLIGLLCDLQHVLSRLARHINLVLAVRIGLTLVEQFAVLVPVEPDCRRSYAVALLVVGIAADARQVLRIHHGLIGIIRGIQHNRFPLVEGAPHVGALVLVEENRVGGPGLPEPLGLRRIGRAVPLEAAVPDFSPGEQRVAAEEEALSRLLRHRVARDIVVNVVLVDKARHAVCVVVVLRDLQASADQVFDRDNLVRDAVVRVDIDDIINPVSGRRVDELLLLEAAEVLVHIARAVLIALERVKDIRIPALARISGADRMVDRRQVNALGSSRRAV